MTSLRILLEARPAVRRCWRAYEMDGRIGTMGRSKVRSFVTAAYAQAEVHACLRSVRARRDGSESPGDWSQSGLDDRLGAWFSGPDQTGDPEHYRNAQRHVRVLLMGRERRRNGGLLLSKMRFQPLLEQMALRRVWM